jgi:[acyl-carrier-protein] S-malonyltransferase
LDFANHPYLCAQVILKKRPLGAFLLFKIRVFIYLYFMNYAIIFPGQGSQSLGMLSDLADNFPSVKNTFEDASDVLGFDLWQLTQEDQDGLNQTQNTQVAMLAAGYATYQVLEHETGLSPICMAGHSLGEYTALVATGTLNFSDGIQLVRQRAELMQSAVPPGVGAMAAILGLDDEAAVKICNDYVGDGVVEAVNFNSNGQVVIAGNKEAVDVTCEAMKIAGAKRAVFFYAHSIHCLHCACP